MIDDTTTIMSACGRTVGAEEVRHVQEVARLCSGLSRHELALTLCEHWGWVGATGKPQVRACGKLLEKLEKDGLLVLAAKQRYSPRTARSAKSEVSDEQTAAGALVQAGLGAVRPVGLERVEAGAGAALWNAFVQRYHPLGYKRPFGCSLRYYITSPRGLLGCLLLASGARALRCRDEWIGWSAPQRLSNLPYVINNSRFLIFPWVRVPHLASHVLAHLARQVRQDWQARWGYRPVLMETFVDPAHHRGVCYRAAGWLELGESTGQGLRLRGHRYQTSPKLILVRPLVPDCRAHLQSGPPPRSLAPAGVDPDGTSDDG
jgi:hypothetical protein